MKPTKKDIKKWCKALRSGEYKQGYGHLQTSSGYCCLGVACDVFIPKHKKEIYNGILRGDFPESQKSSPKWLKTINENFESIAETRLSILNDSSYNGLDTFTFDEIADLLELVYIHEAL